MKDNLMNIMEVQNSFYATDSSKAGYRLDYMEVFNWGTFNKKVFKISPDGCNSLLTGANASGKSTLVDALVTLIVPAKKDRFYNQSSGVQKKGDRNEKSYVLGYYGNEQRDGVDKVYAQALRTENDYSVLLASFKNTDFKRVTLFQVRYFSSGELKCVFGVSNQPLNIQSDFTNFDGKGLWRKALDKKYNKPNLSRKQIEFFDAVKNYSDRIVSSFGMRTEKALGLFSQITGVKVLDDLDEFIKIKMLETRDSEEQYFSRLILAKRNFDKVKEQIIQLEPINEIAIKLNELNKKKDHLELLRDLSVVWFSRKFIALAEKEIGLIDEEIEKIKSEIKVLNAEQDKVSDEISEIKNDIDNDNIGRQINEVKKKINETLTKKSRCAKKYSEYENILKQLEIKEVVNREDVFVNIRENAIKRKKEVESQIKQLQNDWYSAMKIYDEIKADIDDNTNTIKELRKSAGNITGRVAEIRNEIIAAVGASANEIPFIGQLIKVKDSEKEWENAIERILHNFALRLIVPEKYYKQVNEYVNNRNLKGRIVYHRYSGDNLSNFNSKELKHNSLVTKIDLKTKSEYADWIKFELCQNYDYKCATDLQEFNKEREFAVTKEGLVKSSAGRHEKDDREKTTKKENHVLGWDNKEKIRAIIELCEKLTKQKDKQKIIVDEIDNNIQKSTDERDNYFKLYDSFKEFDEIDYGKYATELTNLEKRKEELEATNDRVKALEKLLAEKKEKQQEINTNIDSKKKTLLETESTRNQVSEQLQHNISTIASVGDADTSIFENEIQGLDAVNFGNISSFKTDFTQKTKNDIQFCSDEISENENNVRNLIIRFKRPTHELTNKFPEWISETNQLPENVEYISEYQNLYKKLVEDDIRTYEKDFKNYLTDNVVNKMSEFSHFFKTWEKDIRNEIDKLNESLKEIDYGKDTYIQLEFSQSINDDVRIFKDYLRSSISNIVDLNEARFESTIEPFIKKLHEKEWRDKVTDVRLWFKYKAAEYSRETTQRLKVHENTNPLSGGEKAQLTYTVMCAAISYQFRLTKSGIQPDSFRFIAIDEAFKAQDEDKARYLISLCKQLHLQLLVVTPSDNINIVEKDISFVHFVQRKDNKESIVFDMPIKQFQEERDKYLSK